MKPERKTMALDEEEKLVMDSFKKSNSKELIAIKTATGLSNKKWDNSMKNLTIKKLIKVVKNEEGLFIEMLD